MYIRQILECGGVSRIEYGYEPEEESVDNEPEIVPSPTYCDECDFYASKCQLTNKSINRDTIACPKLQITHPF